MTDRAYNPLDIPNLSESIVRALMARVPQRMDDLGVVAGAGIYAIYYTGAHPAYTRLLEEHKRRPFEVPIYVGKAVPSGSRIGLDIGASEVSTALSGRLNDHAGSIAAAANLDLSDFYARWLVVDSVWIPLGENMLISRYKPVWNNKLHGFGNHDPGAGRRAGKVSKWDALHVGRAWAELLTGERPDAAELHEMVIDALRDYFAGREEPEPDEDYVEL